MVKPRFKTLLEEAEEFLKVKKPEIEKALADASVYGRGSIRMSIPPKKQSKRRNETRELTKPIEAALNALPGVWAARNTVGSGYHRNGDPVVWGLGTGSADIIGCVEYQEAFGSTMSLFFALEVKWPGKKPSASQNQWADALRKKGAFVAVVHSVEEAVQAVERCRRGESE